ncbi:hypothetical protein C0058_11070 [Pseudomonas sp. NC02]|nr:hypothetical protein C0058_11070 [Pseudomonas sp. NC02]
MPFMPLDVNRLRDSDLAIEATGEEFRAAVMLWCASWNQIPAGSLPNSDTALAAYAGFGRDVKGWKKVKNGALRGFVECSDDRLYHSVVTEKAMDAWAERVEYREVKDNEKARKQRERDDRKRMFEDLRQAGIVLPWNIPTSELRSLHLSLNEGKEGVTSHEPVTVTGHAPDTAKTGTGTGTGIKDQEPPVTPLSEKPEPPAPAPAPEPKPKRKARLPEPFNVSGDMRKWAVDRAPAVHLVNETEKFVNYWRGNGGTKADWPATWRTWFLKAQDDANRRMTGPQRPSNQPLDMTSTDWALEPIL